MVKVASIQEVSIAPAFYSRITQMCIATRATTIPITTKAMCYCLLFTPFSSRPIDRKTEAEAVEANDHEGDVRGRGLHAEASKVRALRASHWTSIQESARYSPKYERFVRPTGLRFKKAHVTHPELKTTFYLDIIGVKKNPQSKLYTELGVITKGTIIEVNVSELGLVTESGKVVWGRSERKE